MEISRKRIQIGLCSPMVQHEHTYVKSPSGDRALTSLLLNSAPPRRVGGKRQMLKSDLAHFLTVSHSGENFRT